MVSVFKRNQHAMKALMTIFSLFTYCISMHWKLLGAWEAPGVAWRTRGVTRRCTGANVGYREIRNRRRSSSNRRSSSVGDNGHIASTSIRSRMAIRTMMKAATALALAQSLSNAPPAPPNCSSCIIASAVLPKCPFGLYRSPPLCPPTPAALTLNAPASAPSTSASLASTFPVASLTHRL